MRMPLIIVELVAPDLIYLNKMPLQAAKVPPALPRALC